MSWVITPAYDGLVSDADATAYLAAVQAADGQLLEPAVRIAVNSFIVGCKSDGIWSAIKGSCILAGARTLAGALVPLVGAAPTNFNFVQGDYNRKTGLKGNTTDKRLTTTFTPAGLEANGNIHWGVYMSELPSGTTNILGVNAEHVLRRAGGNLATSVVRGSSISGTISTGYCGSSVESGTTQTLYTNGGFSSQSFSPSAAASSVAIGIFNRGTTTPAPSDPRIAFYSLGTSLDVSLAASRVTTLINAIDAAI
jgi:hypothetical protein